MQTVIDPSGLSGLRCARCTAKLRRIDFSTTDENEVNAVNNKIPCGYRLLRQDEPKKNGDMFCADIDGIWHTLHGVTPVCDDMKHLGITYITLNDDQPSYTNTPSEQRTINFLAEMQGRIEAMIKDLRNGL